MKEGMKNDNTYQNQNSVANTWGGCQIPDIAKRVLSLQAAAGAKHLP
jgi:hypothetical protein